MRTPILVQICLKQRQKKKREWREVPIRQSRQLENVTVEHRGSNKYIVTHWPLKELTLVIVRE
jgi:hypothetical protein